MMSCKGKRVATRVIPKGENKTKKIETKNNKTKNAKKNNEIEIGTSSQAPYPTQPTQE